jgi:hypothetical protein
VTNYSSRDSHNNIQSGFTPVDLMITISLLFILAGLSTPSITKFLGAYRLHIAAYDMSSYMYKSKSISAKENIEVTLNFSPEDFTGYIIQDSDNNVIARIGFDHCNNTEIEFNKCYDGNIIYESPISGDIAHPEKLTIKSNGLSKRGFAYITNKEKKKYYRVGILSSAGLIGTEKWNGKKWE